MTKTVPAGTVLSLHSQAEADELAHSLACQLAEADRICLEGIDGFACQNEFFQTIVIASSGPANDFVESSTWNIIGGALPPGLTLFPSFTDSFSAVIEGVPGTLGSFTFTVQVILDNGNVGQQTYTITVGGITTASPLTDAHSATAYSAQLAATGLSLPLIWTIAGGNLPDGLLLDAATGLISGEAMEEGDFAFAVQADDGASQCVKSFSLKVTPGNTPCDLTVTENKVVGAQSISDITVLNSLASYGTLPAGTYRLDYVNGCFSYDTNFVGPPPCDGVGGCPATGYSSIGHQIVYNPVTDNLPFSGTDPLSVPALGITKSCADVAANMAGQTWPFTHLHIANISLKFSGWGGYAALTRHNGSPNNPKWQLTRLIRYPTLPDRVRIKSYNAALFTVCGGEPASVNPPWDGTFSFLIEGPPTFYAWDDSNFVNQFSLQGQRMNFAEVTYVNDGSAPSPTGCGWSLEIFLFTKDSWFGYKTSGVTPVGVYTRASGCSAGPATLTIESY